MDKDNDTPRFFFIAFIIFYLGMKIGKTFFKDKLEDLPIMPLIFGIFFIMAGIYIIINLMIKNENFLQHRKYKFFSVLLDATGVKIFYYLLAIAFSILGIAFIYHFFVGLPNF